ncbi:cupin [Vibrio sp. 10N.286.55.E10]|uniref:AraC family transcriptional regulator n=1 Tax=Vibrio TaxID=662 RepID=UPI000C849583|nr:MULTISPECIES: AraC family transcriptional regulator [unclassified Vibrio]CAK3775944.1 AraC family transcriptional regulator [Vibrio crassostreae]PME31991.1 cupin [Vibrio sp. 10N.286.55.E10]PME37136.1 cupin [Vibrio sp. 10N.286.55.E12]PME65946.1 cupin [Vibrio sp. 10N.286.55.C11]PTP16202.1 cupin [Vibrio sp. 10N.286.51.C3]
MDLLSQLMEHFSIRTGVFYSGNLCGVSSFNAQQGKEGHLHVLSAGELSLSSAHTEHRHLSQPCIVYLPNSTPHAIEGVGDGAEVVCANVEYRSGQMNPLLSALPDVIVIPFEEAPSLMPVIEVLSNESSQESSGQQYLMDKLSDALMALIFRHLIEQQKIDSGVFSALAHSRLASVVTAIHRLPARHYSIAEMASLAAMSRTQFIEAFKREVGETPGDYVQKWRVSVAQSLLLQNKPINWVADEVGYNSYSGFSRAFQHVAGVSPRLWLKQNVS